MGINLPIRYFLLGLAAVLVAACAPDSGEDDVKRRGARIGIEGVTVEWTMARALGRSPAGHRLAYAVFTEGRPGGMQAASLSVPRRVDLAQKALRQHPLCRWAGFDPELNEVKSNELRAASAVIVFAITCRGWAKAG